MKKEVVIFILRVCRGVYYRILGLIKLLVNPNIYNQPSYFPEYSDRKKSTLKVFYEQLLNVIRFGYLNEFYFAYGFDIKDLRNKSDYVDYSIFRTRRNHYLSISPETPSSVLRNKWIFGMVAQQAGVKTPRLIALIENYQVFNPVDKSFYKIEEFFSDNNDLDCYCKALAGECGKSVFHLVCSDNVLSVDGQIITLDALKDLLSSGRYLLQETITNQIKEISDIYPNSINTIRLETIKNPHSGEIEFFPPLLRLGANGNTVDNWAQGGLAVEIDFDNCCLGKYGWYKVGYGTKTIQHPNSGITFEGVKVPYLKEAVEDAKKFHQCLPGMHSIGWDIALTDDGPVFIEGNDNWEISLVQMCSRGLAKEFKKWFY